MKKLALLLLLLTACGDAGLRGLEPRVYKEPFAVTAEQADITVMLGASADYTTEWCSKRGIRAPAAGRVTTGCAIRPNSPYNNTARWLVIAVRPTGWNDHPSLSNFGHEVFHALGATHE